MALGEKIKAKSQQRLQQHAGGDVFDCPVIKRPPGSFNTYGKNIDWKCLQLCCSWNVDSRLHSPGYFLNNDFFVDKNHS